MQVNSYTNCRRDSAEMARGDRRLGPVNDGSNVHSSPGHSQLAGRASYEAYASLPYPPSLRLIDVQSHWRRDAVRVHLTGRELRPASEHSLSGHTQVNGSHHQIVPFFPWKHHVSVRQRRG